MPFHPYATRPNPVPCPNEQPHCPNELRCDACGAHICASETAFAVSVEERYQDDRSRVEGVRFVRQVRCADCYYRVEI